MISSSSSEASGMIDMSWIECIFLAQDSWFGMLWAGIRMPSSASLWSEVSFALLFPEAPSSGAVGRRGFLEDDTPLACIRRICRRFGAPSIAPLFDEDVFPLLRRPARPPFIWARLAGMFVGGVVWLGVLVCIGVYWWGSVLVLVLVGGGWWVVSSGWSCNCEETVNENLFYDSRCWYDVSKKKSTCWLSFLSSFLRITAV